MIALEGKDLVRSKEEIWCERRRLSYELKKKIGAQGGKDLLRWKENIWCERRKRFGAGSKSYNTNRGKNWFSKEKIWCEREYSRGAR